MRFLRRLIVPPLKGSHESAHLQNRRVTETVKTMISLVIHGVVLGAFLIPLLALLGFFLLVVSVLMGVTFFVKLVLIIVLLPLRIILWIIRAILRI
jgi:hypothetical protein